MMEEMQKRRPNAGPQFQEMVKQFDKDGDGKLNDEERKAMREAHQKARAQGRPRPNPPPPAEKKE
jgi:Ca2+-binding EF-hand superfamily protein